MGRTENIIKHFDADMRDKDILEVACGSAEFSVFAAQVANTVDCIDLTDAELLPEVKQTKNLTFKQMNAIKTDYADKSFDTIVMFNAMSYLDTVFKKLFIELKRILRDDGCLYIISSPKIDKCIIEDIVIPYLEKLNCKISTENYAEYKCLCAKFQN